MQSLYTIIFQILRNYFVSEWQNFANFNTGLSYTQTGAVCIERTENIVEQSDWLLESKVYC